MEKMQQKSHNHFCFQYSTVHSLIIILSFSPFPLVEHKGPPLLPRPLQVPRPAAPAYCTSAFFKALLTRPPLNLTPLQPLLKHLSHPSTSLSGVSGSREVSAAGNKDCARTASQRGLHRADCCHCEHRCLSTFPSASSAKLQLLNASAPPPPHS